MKNIENSSYLIIAILALIACWFFNIQHILSGGGLVNFITNNFTNPASSSISVDLTFLFLSLSIWICVESKKLNIGIWWLYILSGLVIGISFSFPIFLIHRNLRLKNS